jgi:hypothetical protein
VAGGHCAERPGLHGRHSTTSDASRRGAAVGQSGRADQAVGILAGATRNGRGGGYARDETGRCAIEQRGSVQLKLWSLNWRWDERMPRGAGAGAISSIVG